MTNEQCYVNPFRGAQEKKTAKTIGYARCAVKPDHSQHGAVFRPTRKNLDSVEWPGSPVWLWVEKTLMISPLEVYGKSKN
jgi:hypothetical protein